MELSRLKLILKIYLVALMLPWMPVRAAELVGRVVDATNAQVFSGALIRVRGHEIEQSTDANGFFRVPDMQPGSYLLEVSLPDDRDFVARLILLPNHKKQYIELDYSRINPPDDDEEY